MPTPDPGTLFVVREHLWGGQAEHRSYWIVFDEPQFDTEGPDGAGPYRQAEVWEMYLEPIDESST